jgi:diadenosine tetraphosphate (Ap4A) HIT family hydrolase
MTPGTITPSAALLSLPVPIYSVGTLSNCNYCDVAREEAWISSDLALAVPHPEPVTACHMVVVPRRHVTAFYDLDVEEQRVLWDMVTEIRHRISMALVVRGFDVGFVDGTRTSESHAYVQIIPRMEGDVIELPGGVEWVKEEF